MQTTGLSPDLKHLLLARFLEEIQGLPNVSIPPRVDALRSGRSGQPETRLSGVIEIGVAKRPVRLLIDTAKSAYPRDVREALRRFEQVLALTPETIRADTVPLLLAEALSPGAKELLRKENAGYFDAGGSLFLPAPGAYLFIDKPPPEPQARIVRTLFAGRRAQVLHVLLQQPQDWFGVTDTARRAFVSPTTASQTLTELERLDWVETRGQGPTKERRLTAPAAMLDAWAKTPYPESSAKQHRYFAAANASETLTIQLARALEKSRVEYALTHEAAAQRYARFLSGISQVRCRIPAVSAVRQVIVGLDAKPVKQGANLIFIDANPAGELLFRQRVDEIWLASPIHVYLDLLRGEGRSKEAAEHLRHEKIGF